MKNSVVGLLSVGLIVGSCHAAQPTQPHVIDKIANTGRYEALNPHFKKAFDFLRRPDLASLAPGRYEIDGNNCFAVISNVNLSPLVGAPIESHRTYIDVQAPLTGPETIGLYTMNAADLARPFDAARDCVLFDAQTRPVTLTPGDFAIFWPPIGAHAPGHSSDGARKITKVIIKVRAETESAAGPARTPERVVDGVAMFSIADERARQTVVAEGTESVYQGHPTMCRTADGKRLLAVWTVGHGGHGGPLAESSDGGRTWTRVDARLPAVAKTHYNCPSIYRMRDVEGKDRIWIFSARKENPADPNVWQPMPRLVSEDDGYTWREESPLGAAFWNVMTFSSVVALKEPGHYLGLYHRGPAEKQDVPPLTVWASETRDGGFTWEAPRQILAIEGLSPCEPYVFRSPKGDELCCLVRENVNSCPAYFIVSQDEGRTWGAPKKLPWILGIHRHQGVQLADGRLCILGRCLGQRGLKSGGTDNIAYCKCGAWIGTYEQLKGEAPLDGSQMVALLPNYEGCDTGYPGVVLMDDGSVVCCTYGWYHPDTKAHQCSVVTTRFHPDEFKTTSQKAGK